MFKSDPLLSVGITHGQLSIIQLRSTFIAHKCVEQLPCPAAVVPGMGRRLENSALLSASLEGLRKHSEFWVRGGCIRGTVVLGDPES
jgi:hypothetical protein